MLRIALIGCGHIGTVHSYSLAQLTRAGLVDAKVTSTFDPDHERAATIASHHDARACTDLDAALAEADVAWICTWTAGHVEAVDAAIARDLAVFCEKPLAPTIGECRSIADRLRDRPHQVGLVLRHAPVFAAFVDAVASGKYGRPMTMVFRDDQYFPIQGMYGSTWRKDVTKAGAGLACDLSASSVASTILQYLKDPALRAASAARGQDLLAEQFNWERSVEAMEAVYRQLLTDKIVVKS